MLNTSFLDNLSSLIGGERARAEEEHFEKREAEREVEARATACREQQLVELALSTVAAFMQLEERRVKALEGIAYSCTEFVRVYQHSAEQLHCDVMNGYFRK